MSSKTYLIAEAEINHNGDFATARRMITAAKEGGADCVKFQYIIADEIAVPGTPFHDLFRKMEFTQEQVGALRDFAEREVGIDFLITVPSVLTVRKCRELGIRRLKIGSSNLTNLLLIREIATLGEDAEVYLSSGMGTVGDIETALVNLGPAGKECRLFHCTVSYPAPPESLNLRAIPLMRTVFPGHRVGLSDHSLGSSAAVAAVALGADLIEKHFTLDKAQEGPDHHFSADPAEFAALAKAVRETEAALGHGRKEPTPGEMEMRAKTRRFLVFNRAVAKGTKLDPEMFATKRVAGEGQPVAVTDVDAVCRLNAPRDYAPGEALDWSDFA